MRLKYLTLCILGFSLSACSQHVIKTNSATANLEQKAINSINAMYEYPSYDYRGKFNVHVDLDQKKNLLIAGSFCRILLNTYKKSLSSGFTPFQIEKASIACPTSMPKPSVDGT